MQFKIGSKVKLIDEVYEGIIVSVNPASKTAVVEIDGMDMTFLLSQLIEVREDDKIDLKHLENNPIPESYQDSKKPTSNSKLVQLDALTYEIDLHWEALFPDSRRVTDGEILTKKLAILAEYIAECQRKRARRLVVIHGVGKYILKEAIENMIAGKSGLQVEDAPMRRYGVGASVIYIH